MKWNALDEERCSVARTMSVIGDRWSLLILRDCFLRVRRFDEFQRRLGVTRHILAGRLRKLVDAGVLVRRAYQDKPLRHEYVLTARGRDLHPIMLAMAHWGDLHMSGEDGPPLLYRHSGCGEYFAPVMSCSACGERVEPHSVAVEPGPGLADAASSLFSSALLQKLPRDA